MFIGLSIHDVRDSSVVSTEHLRQCRLGVLPWLRTSAERITSGFTAFVQFPNCLHFFVRKYATRCNRNLRLLRSPAFINRIPIVFKVSTQKQVIRSHARRIVAFVKHVQTIGNWTVRQLPRYSVTQSARCTEATVSVRMPIASPNPTRRRLIDLRPEAINGFHGREVYQFGG